MKFTKLTPNLVVRDVQAGVQFYPSVLGFQPAITVPDVPPYVFTSVSHGDLEIFFNDQKAVGEDHPPLAKDPIGGTMTLLLECDGIEEILRAIEKSEARIVMPLKAQFYGMREFAFVDPQGWMVTMAERVKRFVRSKQSNPWAKSSRVLFGDGGEFSTNPFPRQSDTPLCAR